MRAAGIVAEYDPFHTGHLYHLAQTRAALGEDAGLVVVMSGNWVQRGGCAVADKWVRARLALLGGADLVLELPTVWAVSSAERFARGAVTLLARTGVADTLSFGSECGDVESLREVAGCLDSELYSTGLKWFLDEGMPFAAARQEVVRQLLGSGAELLSGPNNNLGVEYIRALSALGGPMEPMTVLRLGAGHGQTPEDDPPFSSAAQLRRAMGEGRWEGAERYLIPGERAVLESGLPSLKRVERDMLSRVRTMTAEDWSRLPDAGTAEGLPRRLERSGRACTSLEEFCTLAKTRRYTHARLRRLALWAFLGLEEKDIPPSPPYLRVLGFNGRGRELLKEMKECSLLPVLTKPARARDLDETGRRLFELECRCTDLYDLCFARVRPAGREWTTGPVILRDREEAI